MDNHAVIGHCLQHLKVGLSKFLTKHFPGENTADVANCLKLFAFRWNELDAELPRKARSLAHEMLDVRNEWAHQVPFSDEDKDRALDTAERLLRSIGHTEESENVSNLRGKEKLDLAAESVDRRPPKIVRVGRPARPESLDHSTCKDKLLRDIQFSTDPGSRAYKCLLERLGSITDQVYGRSEIKKGSIARQYTPLNFGWVNESRIVPNLISDVDTLEILLHIGDTKEQGRHFFDLNPNGVSWPQSIAGREVIVTRYFKIASPHAKAIMWICPTDSEAETTHSRRFFSDFAGRVYREDWEQFDENLAKYMPSWRDQCFARDNGERVDWNQKVIETNYQYITFSVGTNLRVQIPYSECCKLDSAVAASPLADQYREVLAEVKQIVEMSVQDRIR